MSSPKYGAVKTYLTAPQDRVAVHLGLGVYNELSFAHDVASRNCFPTFSVADAKSMNSEGVDDECS